MLTVHRVDAFDDNYIWLIGDSASDQVAIVDPGDETPVITYLETHALTPMAILLTHHHGDHTGGVEALVKHSAMPVYGAAGGRIAMVDHPLHDGDTVSLQAIGLELQVFETPGHTRDHIVYYASGALFSGDTLFAAGCGRLFEGNAEQMYRSLERIRALPDETQVYCAHEYTLANLAFARIAEPDNDAVLARSVRCEALRKAGESTVPSLLGEEKATNPFLRSHIPALHAAAERYTGRHLKSGAEVFGAVRDWKDDLD